jgi:hypothetical protein
VGRVLGGANLLSQRGSLLLDGCLVLQHGQHDSLDLQGLTTVFKRRV